MAGLGVGAWAYAQSVAQQQQLLFLAAYEPSARRLADFLPSALQLQQTAGAALQVWCLVFLFVSVLLGAFLCAP